MIKRLVVKIGTSLLTRGGGQLDTRRIARLARELSALRKSGVDVVLVTSGAIAAGIGELGWSHHPSAKRSFRRRVVGWSHKPCLPAGRRMAMGQKQAAAAVGQIWLMKHYRRYFGSRGVNVGQVLLTREDFENRTRAQNAFATLSALMKSKVIPIINENDTVAVDEIRLGDNDTLASYVAILVKADLLVLLTDVEGLMTKHPHHGRGELIRKVEHIGPQIDKIAHALPGSEGGTGGMMTKIRAARRATAHGVDMVIANGKRSGLLKRIANGEPVGTFFISKRR